MLIVVKLRVFKQCLTVFILRVIMQIIMMLNVAKLNDIVLSVFGAFFASTWRHAP